MLFATTVSAGAISNPNLKPSFADSTWYSSRAAVDQQMQRKGYSFIGEIPTSRTIDMGYSGSLLGIPVKIRHWFNDKNQLVKTSIIFDKKYDTNLYSDWSTVKSSIDSKYGLGQSIVTITETGKRYDFALQNDITSGKSLSNIWFFPTYGYGIVLSVDKAYNNVNDLFLSVAYESPAWTKELDRRNKSSDF